MVATNLFDFDAAGLTVFFAEHGEKPFRARQILRWIHRFGQCDFIRRAVDLEQWLTSLHGIAFLVQALDQDAANAGPHFGFAGTLGLRHDLDAGGHFLRLHFDDGHRHGARLRRSSSLLVAGATGCAKRAEHG